MSVIVTVQGLEQTETHHYIDYSRGRVHILSERTKKAVCGQAPVGLRRVDKEPTCKRCLSDTAKHEAFLKFAGSGFVPASTAFAFHIWDFPKEFLVHFDEAIRLMLCSELNFRGDYGTAFHHALRRSSHRNGRKTDQPGSYRIWRAQALARHLSVPIERLEGEITAAFAESRINGYTGAFPLEPTPDWAWLAGLWFGSGHYWYRDRPGKEGVMRERTIVFHVERPVGDELVRIGDRIGIQPMISKYMEYRNKRFERVNVFFPAPAFYILRKWGLPPYLKARDKNGFGGGGRRRTSREVYLKVPEFVKDAPEMSRAFVEGYLNSSKFQAWHKLKQSPVTDFLRHDRGCFVTATAPKEEQVVEFLGFVQEVFQRGGLYARIYKMDRVGRNAGAKLQIGGNDGRLLRYFRILKQNAVSLERGE